MDGEFAENCALLVVNLVKQKFGIGAVAAQNELTKTSVMQLSQNNLFMTTVKVRNFFIQLKFIILNELMIDPRYTAVVLSGT